MQVEVRNEIFRLTPEHCLCWPRKHLLAVADVHLGSPTYEQDMARLTRVAERERAQEIVFLGDFAHSAEALSPELTEKFRAWRRKFAGKVTVLLGHHDRSLRYRWPEAWREIPRAEELRFDGFAFRHEVPMKENGDFVWAGHVHPVVKLAGSAGRRPCFFLSKNYALLPAFSDLVGEFEVWPSHHQRVFTAKGQKVVEVGPLRDSEARASGL